MSEKALRKYLQNYAESEAKLALPFEGTWKKVLAVPFFNQSLESFQRLVSNSLKEESLLLIAVVNCPEKTTDYHWAEQILAWLQTKYPQQATSET